MHIIELDATNWKTVLDYWNSLRAALGAPEGYATSIDGMLELMVWDYADPNVFEWHQKHNAIIAPYTVRILNTRHVDHIIRDDLNVLRHFLTKAREEYRAQHGQDINVHIELVP